MPLPTCRIDWRALSSVVDGDDPDRDPDIVPLAHLSVRFTPGLARIVTTSPPETVFLHPIEWKTDGQGYLVSPDGQRSPRLIASDIDPENIWTWTVRISSTPTSPHQITAVSYSFVAPSGGSIDLSTVIPVPAVPARDLPAWQEAVSTTTAARDETLAARDETVTNAASALAAATTATSAATTAAIGGFLSGTGSPQGVVAAPVGSQYRDTAATNGAVIWVKASDTGTTGWVVQHGDTGWRDITALAQNVASGTVSVRRQNNLVRYRFNNVVVVAGTGSAVFHDTTKPIPLGFRFATAGDTTQYVRLSSSVSQISAYSAQRIALSLGSGVPRPTTGLHGTVTWSTDEAWPTTLPGGPM